MVAPLARVERVERVEGQYDFDARVEITNRDRVSHCPLTLPTSAWLPTDVTENIVRARINATDEDGHGRSGDLFVSVGTRTLEVTLGGLDLTSNDPLERWYVLFEPAWGSHRIALMQVPDTAASSFSITGLPTGPGRIALIQTASIAEQDGAATLHAPEGFAGDFAAYTRGWYQAMLLHDDAAPSFVAISPANSSPRFASLGDDVSWTPADGHLVVSCPSATATGVVTFPCGTDATLIVTGYGNVEVAAQGGTPVMLTPGATATPTTTCSNGATEVTWNITTSSLNGRGFDLVLRQEAP